DQQKERNCTAELRSELYLELGKNKLKGPLFRLINLTSPVVLYMRFILDLCF
ncbi:hypothetical protein Csa_023737, partial [Cucumis sativus]